MLAHRLFEHKCCPDHVNCAIPAVDAIRSQLATIRSPDRRFLEFISVLGVSELMPVATRSRHCSVCKNSRESEWGRVGYLDPAENPARVRQLDCRHPARTINTTDSRAGFCDSPRKRRTTKKGIELRFDAFHRSASPAGYRVTVTLIFW